MKHYFLLLALYFLSSSYLFAQTNEKDSLKTENLSEITVIYQADKATPVTFQNISLKEIKQKSVGQEPSFLLSQTPSVTHYSDAGNSQGYSYFRLRGIDQTRINITLDGVPLNEPEDQGAYFSNYPDIFNSVSKIQIQRGVGTSKNGVASYGGSVQLFSPNLYDTVARFGIGYGSFDSFRGFAEYGSGIKNKKAIYVRASKVYSDGYKYNSSNNSQSIFLSTGLFLDKSTWKINLLAGNQKNELAWLAVSDSVIQKDRKTNSNINERDDFVQILAQLQHNYQATTSSSIQSSIYYTFLNGGYDFNLNGFLGLPSTDELYRYDFRSNLIGFFSNYTFSKNNLNFITGVHANTYQRKHTGSEQTLGELYVNTGFKNEASIFSKIEYQINKFNLFADIQYRYSSFDYKGNVNFDKLTWNFINPKAGISYVSNSNTIFYYSIGSTGREPTRNDMFGGNDDLLSDSLGNAFLLITKAESVLNHELGIRKKTKKLNFTFNLFYMDFKNEIVLNGNFAPNGLALTNNVEKSIRTGIETSVSYKLNQHLILVNNSSFNYSQIKEQNESFSPILTPPIIINQEIIYSYKNFLIAILGKYQDASYIDFANSAKVDSYFLVNTRIQYAMTDKLKFRFFVNNITNLKYFNNGYVDFDGSKKYFVQAPINFYAALEYNF
ncbi:outer membrane receptor protein [Bernardetia litoralis DSM 6794]|uniref:Outer membrane receptor protein n=1 Tax=Bernardetia litoralis (strain ATCC 23117 / DSM 6794 / NBRC 15988 / NCIMB 1366 / Fx l1 / Sio-4) TaxID=880071 RepID=I4AQF6_BERLS|nr:TonB-dependent receptor [Bernardetia litoralis]AFM06191.1 outer membrane receptor protein [Bernardetia litoralis DSM 6794]